jgi:hypothetical protein
MMTNRKQTPDVLGAVLGDPASTIDALAQAKATPPPKKAATRKSTHRKPETKALQPRQWEYKIVNFQDYRGWKPRIVDGEEVSGWKQLPDMPDYINQLGLEGWEMSGASNAGRHQLQVFFKRPKKTA